MGKTPKVPRRRRDDERGAALVLTAISMVAILGAGAMGVDVGFTVYGSRQAQAMADTAALDIVQNIGTADSQSTNAGVQSYLNGLLAGVDTDNASNAGLSVTAGWWQGGTFTAGTTSGGCAGTVYSTSPPVQRGQGRRDAGGSADLLGRLQHADRPQQPEHHRRLDTRVRLLHRFVPGEHQHPAVRRPQRPPRRTGHVGERDRPGVPGAGEHVRHHQPADHGVGRPADHLQRHDGVAVGRPVAGHLERRGGEPGGPIELHLVAACPATRAPP